MRGRLNDGPIPVITVERNPIPVEGFFVNPAEMPKAARVLLQTEGRLSGLWNPSQGPLLPSLRRIVSEIGRGCLWLGSREEVASYRRAIQRLWREVVATVTAAEGRQFLKLIGHPASERETLLASLKTSREQLLRSCTFPSFKDNPMSDKKSKSPAPAPPKAAPPGKPQEKKPDKFAHLRALVAFVKKQRAFDFGDSSGILNDLKALAENQSTVGKILKDEHFSALSGLLTQHRKVASFFEKGDAFGKEVAAFTESYGKKMSSMSYALGSLSEAERLIRDLQKPDLSDAQIASGIAGASGKAVTTAIQMLESVGELKRDLGWSLAYQRIQRLRKFVENPAKYKLPITVEQMESIKGHLRAAEEYAERKKNKLQAKENPGDSMQENPTPSGLANILYQALASVGSYHVSGLIHAGLRMLSEKLLGQKPEYNLLIDTATNGVAMVGTAVVGLTVPALKPLRGGILGGLFGRLVAHIARSVPASTPKAVRQMAGSLPATTLDGFMEIEPSELGAPEHVVVDYWEPQGLKAPTPRRSLAPPDWEVQAFR